MAEQAYDEMATLEQVAQQLDQLVQTFEQHPMVQVREQAMEMLALIDMLHRAGLQTLVTVLHQQQPQLLTQLLAHPAVALLLTLYDLLPPGPAEQVTAALETLGPYLASLGCTVEVLDVRDGIVQLSLDCSGEDAVAIKQQALRDIETTLREQVAGFQVVEVHESRARAAPTRAKSFIPLQQVKGRSKSL